MSRLALALLFACVLIPTRSQAHQKSVSYSKWTLVEDGAVAQARLRWFELTSLPDVADAAGGGFDAAGILAYAQSRLVLETEAGPCEPVPSSAAWLPAERGWARLEWRVRCHGAPTSLRSRLFDTLSNHVHLATITGPTQVDVVLSSTAPRAAIELDAGSGGAAGMGGYLRLGVEHILSGWDHVTFLLLLIVVAPRLREVVVLVTGFTVGHSITLAAAALGVVVPHVRAVEATIAASILIVALENAGMDRARGGGLAILAALALFSVSASFGGLTAFWGIAVFTAFYFALLRMLSGAGRLRWVIACLFGFVHGLGFSGALLEQELPRGQLVQALLGFNVGVELGQLAIVACLWPVLQWFRRRKLGSVVVDSTAVAGAVVATFALIVRVFA